ncbi:MAG: NTP transferase domain-containing protein [Hyphomicrobiaceae bacterium]
MTATTDSGVSAILLAAGLSRRFSDGDKLLAPLAGEPLLVHTARAIASSAVSELLAVTGHEHDARRAVLGPFRVRHVVVDTSQHGQGASIAAGVAAVDATARGVMIVPADMPRLDARLLDRLIAQVLSGGARHIVCPAVGGAQRPPVIWPAALLDELRQLEGDGGGKSVIALHADLASPVALDAGEALCLDDVDTHADLRRIAAGMARATAAARPAS